MTTSARSQAMTDPQRSYMADMESRLDELLVGAASVRAGDFIAVHQDHRWARPGIYAFLDAWVARGRLTQLSPGEWIGNAV